MSLAPANTYATRAPIPDGGLEDNEPPDLSMVVDHCHAPMMIEWNGQPADIDDVVAALIVGLWRRGIVTELSTLDDDDGFVWLDFASAAGASAFVSVAAQGEDDDPFDPESIRARATGSLEAIDSEAYRTERCWAFTATPSDLGYTYGVSPDGNAIVDARLEGPSEIEVGVGVSFPLSDLDEVTRRVCRPDVSEDSVLASWPPQSM